MPEHLKKCTQCGELRDLKTYPKCKKCRRHNQKTREDERVEKGLCFRCGLSPIQETNSTPPSKSCQTCNERNTQIRSGQVKTEPKIKKSFCSICKGKRDGDSSWCNACLSNYRNERLEKGLCVDCGEPKIEGDARSRCKKCSSSKTNQHFNSRHINKIKLIKLLGSQCQDCNLKTNYYAVYHFHHLNKDLKEQNMATLLGGSWENVIKELDKGMHLLCAVCHIMRHQKEYFEKYSVTDNDLQEIFDSVKV